MTPIPTVRLGIILALIAQSLVLVAADRPNILWITTEDMSPNLGSYGDSFARTPNLDAFAREAVRYTRAFAAAPVCSPSRAALITGVYANSLGNPHLRSYVELPKGFSGYPTYLRSVGYYTSNNFKTDYNLRDESSIVRQWWDSSDPSAHWRGRAEGQPFMAVFNIMDTHQSRSSAWPVEKFELEVGSKLSDAVRADPVLVPLPPFYPHTPASRKAMARYYDCISVMDMKVGEILHQLVQDGLAEDTIVFFFSDHGMGMPRGKRLLHDSGMRVPLLIRFPKKWAHLAPASPGSSVDRLVTFVDFAPTLLSIAGIPAPAHFQGKAFLGKAGKDGRRYVFGARDRVDEAFDTARSARDERWLYIRNYRPHLSWAPPEAYSDTDPFRVELLKLARDQDIDQLKAGPSSWLAPTRPREELYDTLADPNQLRNLAGESEHAHTLEGLRGALKGWIMEIRDVSLLAEDEVSSRTTEMTPYALGHTPRLFDLEKVLSAAEAVGDPIALEKQIAWLSDRDSGVRYWAAVGLAANVDGAKKASTELLLALRDSSSAVRVEAAGAYFMATRDRIALESLADDLYHEDNYVALHAARTLELMGKSAEAVLPKISARLRIARSLATTSTAEYYVSMALGSLVDRLAGEQVR